MFKCNICDNVASHGCTNCGRHFCYQHKDRLDDGVCQKCQQKAREEDANIEAANLELSNRSGEETES